MYNEDRKKQFMANTKTAQTLKFVKTIFKSLAEYEQKHDTDLCDISTKEYPDLLMDYVDIQRLHQLYRGLQILETYKVFCISKHWVNPIQLTLEYSDHEWEQNKDKYIAQTYNQKHKMTMLNMPNECFDYIIANYYPRYQKRPIWTYDSWKPIMDDLCLCFMMFTYYGLSQQDMAMIEISKIHSLSSNQLYIDIEDKKVLIEGKFAEYLQCFAKSRQSDDIMFHGVFHVKHFSDKFLMCFDEENSLEHRVRRLNRIYRSTMKLIADDKLPSMVNLQYQGTIYRMAKYELQNQNHDYENWTHRQWIDVYEFYKYYRSQIVVGTGAPRGTDSFLAKDIKNAFLVEYNYLANLL